MHNRIWPYVALVCAVAVAYLSSLGGAFLLDDNLLIVNNQLLRDWHSIGNLLTSPLYPGSPFYRPVQMLLYLVVYQIAGPDPVAFHLLNIGLHIINALLIFTLGRRMGFTPLAAFAGALLWALHPIHTEAIAYISGTADLLSVFFCLLGLKAVVPDFSPRGYVRATALFALALLSKESAVVFPLLVMSCVFYIKKGGQPADYLRTEWLWVMEIMYVGLRFRPAPAATPTTAYSLPDYNYTTDYGTHVLNRVWTSLATLPDYAALLLWPTSLHEERAFPVFANPLHRQVLVGAALVITALGIIVINRKGLLAPLGWGCLWFGAAHSINSGIPLSLDYIIAEHWMYLPSAGLFLGAAQSAVNFASRYRARAYRLAGIPLIIMLALACGFLTYRQNFVWHDTIALLIHAFHYETSTSAAHVMLGNAYMKNHHYDAAVTQYRTAISMVDTLPMAPSNLAIALLYRGQQGDIDEGIAAAKHALDLGKSPVYADVTRTTALTLAALYEAKGDTASAAFYRNQTLKQ